jgi:type III secretion protein U
MSTSKTEEPTPRRLREARRRGEVPKSRELVSAAALFAALGALAIVTPPLVGAFRAFFETTLSAEPARAIASTASFATPLFLVLFAIALASALAAFTQVGPLWSTKAIAPDVKRLDPVKGAKRLISGDRFVDLARHLLMLSLAGAVAVSYVADVAPELLRRSGADLGALGGCLFGLALRVGVVLALFSVLDLFLQRRRHRRSLRMSREEVQREHREAEGDPHGKHARTRAHREAVEHGTLEEVRRASVLVVNPTHFAVALRFDEQSEQDAPEVVAKGMDDLARRMIAVARESGVPVVRDVPLARALHEIELGEEIPETFYQAVAAILEVAAEEREAS